MRGSVLTGPDRARLALGLVAVSLIVATALLFVGPAGAATVTVNCPSGDLQGAIDSASPGTTIVVNGTCYGNFRIDGTNANNFGQLTLQGGSPRATLNGRGVSTTLAVFNGANATVRNLTITNGNSPVGGGVEVISGGLTMANSTIANNHADEAGGGLHLLQAQASLTGVTVTRNSANENGGGLSLELSEVGITASTFSSNKVTDQTGSTFTGGGGIYLDSSDLLLTNTRVTANTSTVRGGGIEDGGGVFQPNPPPPPAPPLAPPLVSVPTGLSVVNSSVDHNVAHGNGGGILSMSRLGDAPVAVQDSTVSFNNALQGGLGGGIANIGICGHTATLLVTGSALQGNQAANYGGAIGTVGINFGPDVTCGGGTGPGVALVTVGQSAVANGASVVNQNRASRGGGIGIAQADLGVASVSLQPGAKITGNKASTTGGGVFNDCGSFSSLGQILLNTPNNVVSACP